MFGSCAPRAGSRPGGTRTQDEALAKLVVRYLAAYGPATLKELLRWWGVARVSAMRPVIERLGDAITEVDVDGTPAFIRSEDVPAIEATRVTKGTVRLIGGFDPFIVGAGLREQLIPAKHLKRVSRTAGWISPVVLVDGRAAGVWDRRGRGAASRSPSSRSPTRRRARGERSRRPRTKWVASRAPASVSYGPVFPEKVSKAPFNDR